MVTFPRVSAPLRWAVFAATLQDPTPVCAGRSPKKRWPFQLVPVIRLGDLRQARIVLPVPGEAILQHHHPLRRAVPLANQQRSRLQTDPVSPRRIARREETDVGTVAALRLPDHPQRRPVEVTQRRDLHALRENPR
jgi:hypothetical protein